MKALVIAEKPSVAADIAKSLGKFTRKEDLFENEAYIITSALGHLVELYMPEDMDKRFSFWRLEDLPIIPEKFQLKPIEKTAERFRLLAKLLRLKEVGSVINACDAGREGELIFNYIYDLAGGAKPVRRLWMSSMTPSAIRSAFDQLREGGQMQPLADAARSRSEADWLIGINGTRAVTKRLYGNRKGSMATVGRVQTPTLAIVLQREREIRAFRPRAYSRVVATFTVAAGPYEGVYQRPDFRRSEDEHDRADRLWDRSVAEAVAAAATAAGRAEVTDEARRTTQIAPRLYDLTTLQREANNRFGFPARRTLQIAQALYEQHKMLTYPRTDSRALPEDYGPTVRDTLAVLGPDHAPFARRILDEGWVRPNKRIFNNAEVSDHFAIIPTNEAARSLDEAEARIYDLVVRRFLAVFYPVAQFDVTTRLSRAGEHVFRSEGKVLVDPGWLAVYGKQADEARTEGEAKEKDRSLPPLSRADGSPARADLAEVRIEDDVTRPPARYTEATLLSAMENAGRLVDDSELAEAMKERGLGTPATRAAVIEHLLAEKYLSREQRELVPTAKAEQVLDFLGHVRCDVLTSPALTGEWEYKLRAIEHGRISRADFMAGITDLTRTIVANTRAYTDSKDDARRLDWPAFTDGEPMLEYDRKFGSQDGKLEVYKIIGNRRFAEDEVRALVEKRRLGPIDNFVSKAGKRFSAFLELAQNEAGQWRPKFVFDSAGPGGTGSAATVNLDDLTPIGRCPRTGAPVYETSASYVVRLGSGPEEKLADKLPRNLLGRDIPREQYFKYLEQGRTDLLDKFWSRRTRKPFSAALVRKADGTGFDFEFAKREGGPRRGPPPARGRPPPTAEGDSAAPATSAETRPAPASAAAARARGAATRPPRTAPAEASTAAGPKKKPAAKAKSGPKSAQPAAPKAARPKRPAKPSAAEDAPF